MNKKVMLNSDTGIEILIHSGLDTVDSNKKIT